VDNFFPREKIFSARIFFRAAARMKKRANCARKKISEKMFRKKRRARSRARRADLVLRTVGRQGELLECDK
jgi:hypothetical protein